MAPLRSHANILFCSGVFFSCIALLVLHFMPALDFEKDESSCVVNISRQNLSLPTCVLKELKYSRGINKILEEEDFYGDVWFHPLVQMKLFRRYDYPVFANDTDVLDKCMSKVVRKYWEFAQGVYALEVLGVLNSDNTALGIGSGHEEILFYMASRLRHVTAVDLYDRGGWRHREGNESMIVRPWEFARFPYPRDRLTAKHMDATALSFPDNHFDIVFSFSALEHFYSFSIPNGGFLAAAARAVREMARVLRPGGVAIIVTEIILNGKGHYDWIGNVFPMRNFFHPHEIEQFIVKPAAEAGMFLVEDIDWCISNRTLAHSVPLGRCRDDRPHLVLRGEGVVWTSISLVFRK
jgi:SAM-dependent methyltransferase